jgi:2-polyprenyl-6-methoxyphenol hydroxylase-like FAD-dependent oxidoreductase
MAFDADVIVAGCGPVGLTASLALAAAGVRVLALEKRSGLGTASLASTIHPPTLEILDDLGVLAPVLAQGQVADTIQHRTPEGVFAEFHLRDLATETRFPFRLHLEQSRITPVMLDRLRAAANAEVRFGHEVVDVQSSPDRVTARLDGAPPVTAKYLLAADGAHSAVRHALGIGFDGADYPDKILRLLTTDDLDRMLPGIAPVTYLYHGARSISFLKMADCWRIILRVPEHTPELEAMDAAWIRSRFQAVLPGGKLPSIAGRDVYGASRRVAASFRQGRIYLIGDAAHVTSTRGGMNMNCGIHDAAALARAIVDGTMDAAADERRRVATEALIPRTDRSVSGGDEWRAKLREMAGDDRASAAYLRRSAMLDMLDRAPAHA